MSKSLEETVWYALKDDNGLTREKISNMVEAYSALPMFSDTSQTQKEIVIKNIESSLCVSMDIGVVLKKDFKEWYKDKEHIIDPYYWHRYKEFLSQDGYNKEVISSIDQVTSKIVGLLEDPSQSSDWLRKGMVVGHVQSGKTANYIGVMNKAADAGYKLFIVIAGIHNELRDQTQERIEEGFIGRDTSHGINTNNLLTTGVGKIDVSKLCVALTTRKSDFKTNTAQSVAFELDGFPKPIVLVIKKNNSTLKSLITWLKNNNTSEKLRNIPMLLIDDEADNASINTHKDPEKATRINKQIRELLHLFKKRCYLGYTATPFANVFINPADDEDLFPEDFIYCLDAPDNYIGSEKMFGDNGAYRYIIRDIPEDDPNIIPIPHTKDYEVEELPDTLKEAVRIFILTIAIRVLRGDKKAHKTMLVNASRFTNVQNRIKDRIFEEVRDLQEAIRVNYGKPDPLRNAELCSLYDLYEEEYKDTGFSWQNILEHLFEAVSSIEVLARNTASSDVINYDKYEEGLNAIVVGGNALSRGLTLKGLIVSYFYRNSSMYDTLMQMGRWFGYRAKYDDLCRVYMTEESKEWYAYISDATEELRNEIKIMIRANKCPSNFGLRVKKHPHSLLITAKNKMYNSSEFVQSVDLDGSLIETTKVSTKEKDITQNRKAIENLISSINRTPEKGHRANLLWRNVSCDKVLDFINSYINHESCTLTQRAPLVEYIEELKDNGKDMWDVALVSKYGDDKGADISTKVGEYSVVIQERQIGAEKLIDGVAISTRRRISAEGIEREALSGEDIDKVINDNNGKAKDAFFRAKRDKPLLMLHIFRLVKNRDGKGKEKSTDATSDILFNEMPGYGISFPGLASERRASRKQTKYVINMVYQKENAYIDLDEEEDDD